MQPRHLGEIGAAGDDALADVGKPALRVGLGHELVGAYQDVPRVGLLHRRALFHAAAIDQLEDVESAGAAQYRAGLARFHAFHRSSEYLRFSPAEPEPIIIISS